MAKTVFISSDKKNVIKRIVLFILFLIIAVVSLTYGVNACAKQYQPQEGLQKIELDAIKLPNDQIITPFENEINFYYYIEKTKKYSISEQYSLVNQVYQQIAYTSFLCFHSEIEFEEYKNLAYITNHPNEVIQVSDFLFNALKDAYQKTIIENSPYNVFSGKIYDFWEELMYSSTKNPDPALSAINKILIEKIVLSLNQKDAYSLTFNDERKTITYVLLDETLKEDLKLDFNVLYEAYVIQTMADYLKTYGLQKGYFISQNGYYLHLKEYWTKDETVSLAIHLYAKQDSQTSYQSLQIASFLMNGSVMGSTFTNYYLNENDSMKYQITLTDGTCIRRHLYYDALTGYPLTTIRYSRIYTNSTGALLADIGFDNLILMTSTQIEAYAYVLANNDQDKKMLYIVDNGLLDDIIDDKWNLYYQNVDSFQIEEIYQNQFHEIPFSS